MTENEIGTIVVDCVVRLHKEIGPGLLESVYEVLLAHLLCEAGFKVACQVLIPIEFHGIRLVQGFRADIIIEDKVILELKSIESFSKAHKKQDLTYLKLTGYKLGYLLNFGENMMKDGITRVLDGILSRNKNQLSHEGTEARRESKIKEHFGLNPNLQALNPGFFSGFVPLCEYKFMMYLEHL